MPDKKFVSIAFVVFLVSSFLLSATEYRTEEKAVKMPDGVKVIIEKSCFGCHNTDSKNDKAKEKLDLKTLDQLTKNKMIASLKEISETIEENEMPPAKFLEKFPDKKLTDAEKKILMEWANSEAKTLIKQ